MSYQEWLERKAKEQLETQGRIDMCLASEMMAIGMDVHTIEKQLINEIENNG